MRSILVIILVLPCLLQSTNGQNPIQPANTADRIIEGGNLIVEILKVIHGGDDTKAISTTTKDPDCLTQNFTNICFTNRSDRIILVTLKRKHKDDTHELIVANNGKECCYRISPGIYVYTIAQKSKLGSELDLIRKGEVVLERCKDLEVKIK